jgi:hypothetical protein
MNALQRLNWKNVTLALALALAMQLEFIAEATLINDSAVLWPPGASSRALVLMMLAISLLVATLAGDAAVDRGAERLPAYAGAVVGGCALAALLQLALHRALGWPTDLDQLGHAHVNLAQPASVFLELLMWAAIVVFIHANRRQARIASARMAATQLARASAQRRSLDSRLKALQARIEPQFLFGSLTQVRSYYDSDPAAGSRMLDDLIDYLHAALPQLREADSSLAHELELVRAFARVRLPRAEGAAPALHIEVADSDLGVRMPAMVLLPLFEHLLRDRETSAPVIAARAVAGGFLQIELADRLPRGPALAMQGPPDDIAERLRLLYGEGAELRIATQRGEPTRIVLRIPHEPTDGDPR